jgi:hypothetical protein
LAGLLTLWKSVWAVLNRQKLSWWRVVMLTYLMPASAARAASVGIELLRGEAVLELGVGGHRDLFAELEPLVAAFERVKPVVQE